MTDNVYAVHDYERCSNQDCDENHSTITAIYATKQTAQQHAARHGGVVRIEHVLTKVREW